MAFGIYDIVGIVGVALVLTTYGMVQSERMSATSKKYQVLNMVACVLIGFSLIFAFNWPSAIIQSCWFLISGYGLVRSILADSRNDNS